MTAKVARGTALLLLGIACAPTGMKTTREMLRPVPLSRAILIAPAVDVRAASGEGAHERRSAIERRLWAALDEALTGGGRRADIVSGTDSVGAGAARTERIQRALAGSPVMIHREVAGVSRPARHRLAVDDVRAIAQAGKAEGIIVARLIGKESTASRRAVESAASTARKTAEGVFSLSPMRVVKGLLSTGQGTQQSNLRVALVHGESGEILWASSVTSTRPPSTETVDDLVRRAVADFPPLVRAGD